MNVQPVASRYTDYAIPVAWREHITKKKKETARPQNEGDKMANREKLTTLTRKQVTDIQNSNKTDMDLRHRTLGLRQ